MKNTKICTKCGSTDIVRFDGMVGGYGAGNNIYISALRAVKVNRYICCRCGFCEEWIDREELEKVKNSKKAKRWPDL